LSDYDYLSAVSNHSDRQWTHACRVHIDVLIKR
jgi:hypothetical protein